MEISSEKHREEAIARFIKQSAADGAIDTIAKNSESTIKQYMNLALKIVSSKQYMHVSQAPFQYRKSACRTKKLSILNICFNNG